VFESPVNIYSAFHSPDGKFFVVNHGSGAYGTVSVVFRDMVPGAKPYLSESDYRGILENGLKDLYPELRSGELDHLYAPKRDIRDEEAFLYAGGDFVIENAAGTMYQKAFKGVFLALNLERRTIRRIKEEKGLRSWYRGLPDNDAMYDSVFFVSSRHVLTNAHVVADAKRVAIGLGNKEVWADVVATSNDFDLCLLALPENSLMGVRCVLQPLSQHLARRLVLMATRLR
jgi:S1-C subfamily serine protease